jgi:endonuclease YncB( thermonuclease family)
MSYRLLPAALALALASLLPARADEVYVTETGDRYHREGCLYLQRTRIPIPLPEATALGYEPCATCSPPSAPAGPAGPPAGLYRVNVAGLTRCEQAEWAAMPGALVVRPIDGDTVRVAMPRPPAGLRSLERVRLLGVDAPDGEDRFGREAGEFTRRRLLHQVVRLACDWRLRDRYGRLLAYVYLSDGACHNADLLREGFAHAYTRFPFQFLEEFRALESAARRQGRGLWGPGK